MARALFAEPVPLRTTPTRPAPTSGPTGPEARTRELVHQIAAHLLALTAPTAESCTDAACSREQLARAHRAADLLHGATTGDSDAVVSAAQLQLVLSELTLDAETPGSLTAT